MARQVLENGVILPAEYSDDWYDDMTSNLTKLDDVIGSDSEKLSSADVGAAALSNNYNDLDNLPTIPTVNDATLTIQKNGVNVQTFTANASSNVTANITVPTKTSDLTNDSNFVDTSNAAVASGITSAKVTDYDTHIADTDIHVTTADKNRWNNNTYVFRYSSTALVASSTNSNALLDNTDNLKVGDKVIDSSGVLFSITAIDTQNSTFTIGTALIDLAQDSDVVHLSGNETKSGELTLSSKLKSSDIVPLTNLNFNLGSPDYKYNNVYAYMYNSIGRNLGNESSNNQRTNITLYANRDTQNQSCAYITRFRQNRAQGALQTGDLQMIGFDVLENEVRTNNVFSIQCSGWVNNVPQRVSFISSVQSYSYGNSTNKALINGLNPSSLSLPDLNNGIDISSYIPALDNGNTQGSYTPSVNGFIVFRGGASTGGCSIVQGNMGNNASYVTDPQTSNKIVNNFLPVIKDNPVVITVKGLTSIEFIYFYPCQGNV